MEWYNLDQIGQPTSQTINIGRLWTFRFSVPPEAWSSFPPAKGTNVAALAPFVKVGCVGCVGATGFGARVKDVKIDKPGRDSKAGNADVIVTVIEPQGYSADATGPELRGSRTTSKDSIWQLGEMLFISTDGKTGVPVPRVTYFTPPPSGSTVESGLMGRRCRGVSNDWDLVPGLCVSTASFIGAEPFVTGTDGPEIKGSRKERREKDGKNSGQMLFLSTTTTAGVPIPGRTYFTNMDGAVEGGLNGRVCNDVVQDQDTVPGIVFTRANFLTSGWGDVRQPNVARISGRALGSSRQILREPKGKKRIIQGWDFETDPDHPSQRIITKGAPTYQDERCILVIETAFASLDLGVALSFINSINANHMTNLGLPARTLRMLGPSFTRWWLQGALWYFDYHMLYDPAEHNICESQRITEVVRQVAELDKDGVPIVPEKLKDVVISEPKAFVEGKFVKVDPDTRLPFVERSWSALDGWIVWT